MIRLLSALLALLLAAPVAAQMPPAPTIVQAAPAFDARVHELLGILAGTADYDAYFAPGFRAAIPKAMFDQVNAQMGGQYGKPLAVEGTKLDTPWSGMVNIRFEKDILALLRMTGVPRLPSRIDTIEWFFSPADLIRVMDWLRRNTEGPKGADARAVLSKNPGLTIDKAQFAWTGFKGGSEPGVINLTVLLQGLDGAWYAAAASWNDTTAPVENERFAGLISALVKFAGPGK